VKRALGVLVAATLPTLALLAVFEVVLRSFPALLPMKVATAVYSVYGDKPGDIYFRDRPTRSVFMWPNYETTAFWNGYRWRHRTDALGFRNPPDLADRSLVLLGDSMIYGHGVEENDTVAHFLRTEYGRGAYSGARQGDCLYQEYLVARRLLPKLRPKTLVVTTFINDFEDLEIYRKPDEIAEPTELSLDVDALNTRIDHPRNRFRLSEQVYRLKVWRLGVAAWDFLRTRSAAAAEGAAAGGQPPFTFAITDDARYAPIAHYYEVVLADLARRTHEAGTELVLLDLDLGDALYPNMVPAQDRVWALLESIAQANGIRALDTRAIYTGCETCFLAHDGHLTREGHHRLAGYLAAQLP
jgi:hypothetical protein